MAWHNHPLFSRREDIPDLVPPVLLISPDHPEVRIARAEKHSRSTTSPIEVGFYFYEFNGGGDFGPERNILDLFEGGFAPDDLTVEEFLRTRGNHLGRVIMKALLDPDRYAPIDLVAAYRMESKVRGYSPHEEAFFETFTENWGVLIRS